MKPASPDPVKGKLESRLRYYEDLGIRAFYRDRVVSQENSLPAGKMAAPSEIAAPPATQERMQEKMPEKMPQQTPPAAKISAPPQAVAPAQEKFAKFQAIAHGPSLFEAAERVEGDTLERISSDLGECTRCKLHRHRNKIVFGVGNPHAELVFVGEGPGHDEDVQGIPFVGRAGKLLTQMIEAMGLHREDVYIANVVKCRPPENRTPEKDEVGTCMPFLFRQLGAIEPKVIVCLGSCATQALLGTTKSISTFRGQWFDFRGAKLIPTYHPAYLLRNPNAKPDVWADLKKVMVLLGLKPPRRKS
jgi:uracil-DNA glycosylase